MKILWFTWKDTHHPAAGGAEVVNEELAKRLVAEGHEVIFVVGGFAGGSHEEDIDGYKVIRVGGRYSVYWHAYHYYKKHLSNWPDLVIDEVNTIPFFARFYVRQPVILLIHQLCRPIWFFQMHFPLSAIGYLLEPGYLWLLRKSKVITISDSTKRDLMRCGFEADKIRIISEGIKLAPLEVIGHVEKYGQPTVLSLGAIRPMKRTLDQIAAFEHAKKSMPNLQMKIAGGISGKYGQQVLDKIQASPFATDIHYLGRVSEPQKTELMQKSHVILVTSIKEGWGLIVTEAASQGTPAIVYDVDGLRDSVRDGRTGLVCAMNAPKTMGDNIVLLLNNHKWYTDIQKNAWRWSQEITFERSYREFKQTINL